MVYKLGRGLSGRGRSSRGRSVFYDGPKRLLRGAEMYFHEGPKCLEINVMFISIFLRLTLNTSNVFFMGNSKKKQLALKIATNV